MNNSLQITRLQSDNLTVSGPDMPTNLSGKVKWERPYNFRLEAGLPLMGNVLAAGSNSEMFWLKTQMPSPPTLYYARHDEFDRQTGPRAILPVSPLWLREAMGVVELDPSMPHDPPILRPDGRLEVRSMIPSSHGSYRRHIVLNPSTGVMEQTLLYNQVGKLVAIAEQSDHEYHAKIDYSLPRKVDIQLLPDSGQKIVFSVQVGFYLINQDTGAIDDFALPEARGLTAVDLTKLNGIPMQPDGTGITPASAQMGYGNTYNSPYGYLPQGQFGPGASRNGSTLQGYPSLDNGAVKPPNYTAENPSRRSLFNFNRIRR